VKQQLRKMNGEEFDELVSFFDGMASTKWLGSIHDELKKLTGEWSSKSVLDVGCGTGRLLLRGIEEAQHLTGIDLSSEMVKASKQNFFLRNKSNKGTFLVGDAYELPFQDRKFDIALSTCVMFLLPEPERGIKEMLRVIKDNGMIGMLNPTHKMNQGEAFAYCKNHGITGFEQTTMLKWSNVSTKRHRYEKKELTSLLESLGATSVSHTNVLEGLAMITVASKK
jgi:ubiquinone/menaquinone biosynthesis C-methylase UbiE